MTPDPPIPPPLDRLGQVFVVIPAREKAATVPRDDDHTHEPDDPVLVGHLREGWNYGIACRGDVAILDADDPDTLAPAIDRLPDTVRWVTGSREGEAHLFRVPGLDEDIPLSAPDADPGTDANIGHVKGAAQSYCVGPGSVHPSGNRYGPLEGDRIAEVDPADLREAVAPFRPPPAEADGLPHNVSRVERPGGRAGEDLSVYDVIPRSSYPPDTRRPHPVHGSSTGKNFHVDEGGDTWRCWRHDVTGDALHLVGVEAGAFECGAWRTGTITKAQWADAFEHGRQAGYLPERASESDDADARHVERCSRCHERVTAVSRQGVIDALNAHYRDAHVGPDA